MASYSCKISTQLKPLKSTLKHLFRWSEWGALRFTWLSINKTSSVKRQRLGFPHIEQASSHCACAPGACSRALSYWHAKAVCLLLGSASLWFHPYYFSPNLLAWRKFSWVPVMGWAVPLQSLLYQIESEAARPWSSWENELQIRGSSTRPKTLIICRLRSPFLGLSRHKHVDKHSTRAFGIHRLLTLLQKTADRLLIK